VIVLGGMSGAAGAAVLSASAAVAAGAGMVRLLGSDDAVAAALVRDPAIMAKRLSPTIGVEEHARWADIAVLGPGWLSLTDEELARWIDACDRATTAMVIDATALRVLAERGDAWQRLEQTQVPVVLTPHLGEWRGLTGDEGSIQLLHRVEVPRNVTVVVEIGGDRRQMGRRAVDVLRRSRCCSRYRRKRRRPLGLLGGSLARIAGRRDRLQEAIRWALTCHLAAGRRATEEGRIVSASELVGEIASNGRREYR
jgi:NAD(P)H-hydrate repair Nnr-like enzyme with NAD(P)H-hydrate dehydratase domain